MSYCEQCAALQRQNDFLANDRDGYVQLLTDENNKLRAENERFKLALTDTVTQTQEQAAEIVRLRAALGVFACDCEGKAICLGNCMHRNARAALEGK